MLLTKIFQEKLRIDTTYLFFTFLGKNGSGATETKHWQDMITKPRQTIVQWHRLKPE